MRKSQKFRRYNFVRSAIVFLFAFVLTLVHWGETPSQAGDFPEHWHLIHYVARVAGFNFDDARLIADASWAMDQNADTLATGHLEELRDWLTKQRSSGNLTAIIKDNAALQNALYGKEARVITQAVLLHSLISKSSCLSGEDRSAPSENSARDTARKLFLRYVHEMGQRDNPSPDEGTRKLRLILIGMFLHYVVDSHVHPELAIPGHADQGHQTDYAPTNPERFTEAAIDAYRVLVSEQGFLCPQGGQTSCLLADRQELIKEKHLAPADYSDSACLEDTGSARCFFGDVVNAIAKGYHRRKIGGWDEADPSAVSAYLDEVWFRSAYRHVYDNLLGAQRSGPGATFVIYGTVPDTGETTIELPSRTLPKNQRWWRIKSFVRYVQEDQGDEYDALREQLRQELLCQLRFVLKLVQDGTDPWQVAGAPAKLAGQMTTAVLNIVVGGSGSNAQQLEESSWAPRPLLMPTSDRSGVQLENPTRRIIIEVRQREWSTEGLEKYLKPGDNEGREAVRFQINPGDDPLANSKLKSAIDNAVRDAQPVSLVFEAPQQLPDASTQWQQMATIAEYAAGEHRQVHQNDSRALYLEGAATSMLPLLQDKNVASVGDGNNPLFSRTIAVSPLPDQPVVLPENVTVVLQRDNLFMNFDPGSPGYQQLQNRARQFANSRDVMVVDASEAKAAGATRIEYLPKGASEPVTLSNSRLNQVVSDMPPGQDSQATVQQILQREGQHKPSNVGGISLVTSATMPIAQEAVQRATYDLNSNQIVLYGLDNRVWKLPPMDRELVRNAFDCLYGAGISPELSIGSKPDAATFNPGQPGYAHVYSVGDIDNTRLQKIMFDADHLLARLAFGGSQDAEELDVAKLGIHTLPELFPSRYADTPKLVGSIRVYMVPSVISFYEKSPGQLELRNSVFDVRFDPSGPAEAEFSRVLMSHWSEFLTLPAASPFRQLVEAAQVVAVFNWLKEHHIVFDGEQMNSLTRKTYFIPADVPPFVLPKVEALKPQLPYKLYSTNGLEKVCDESGQCTNITYFEGHVQSVQRKDGKVLRIYFDDLNNPTALALDGSALGAAFYHSASNGSSTFADSVKLRLEGGEFKGFDSMATTTVLYNVDRTALLATIVQNFITEAHRPKGDDWWSRNVAIISAVLLLATTIVVIYFLRRRRHAKI